MDILLYAYCHERQFLRLSKWKGSFYKLTTRKQSAKTPYLCATFHRFVGFLYIDRQ